jgi:hypothetical protein
VIGTAAMPGTAVVGILRERHSDHIVLSNGTAIFLVDGVSADHVPIGRSLTVTCTIRDGRTLATAIRLNPDWLLDALDAVSLSG